MRRSLAPVLLFAILAGGGCGDDATFEMDAPRKRDRAGNRPSAPMSAAERLGVGGHGDPHAGLGMIPTTQSQGGGYRASTPPGWIEKPSSGMRKGSWAVDAEPRTDCSLVVLKGTGGGLAANIDRWRGEMGQAETSRPEAWPRLVFLDQPALYVNFTGSFTGGRGGAGRIEEAKLLGLLLERQGSMVFLKFTGPAAVVDAHKANFEALAASIEEAPQTVAHGAQDAGTADPGHGLAWDAPTEWQQQPGRSMRLFTFHVVDNDKTWCYASRLRGGAGGITANVNRWRGEMGQEPLPQSAVDLLPRIAVLGSEGVLIDLAGDFRGTGGPPLSGARLFGFVCPSGASTLFIKMVGPAATMPAHRAAFDALCRSLRDTP